jgi:nitroimidazol reductase NimA-like FMN-containing flavoprotein (pyridoxamine 5'-phosphate oxidase superfamily)
MSEGTPGGTPETVTEELDEAECLRLVAGQEVGRIAYSGRFGPTVLPVNYRFFEGSVVFRTGAGSPMDEDLRTGIEDAEYRIAFEVDELETGLREGWSVLIQGSAHHVTSAEECAAVARAGVIPWAAGPKDAYLRIRPTRVTGRRLRHPG